MKKNKQNIKRNTFSNAPSWYNNKKRAEYEKDKRTAEHEVREIEKMARMVDSFVGTNWR